MDYKFSLTPRLIALAIFSGIALMVLLFALGYQVGKSGASAPEAGVRIADQAGQRGEQRFEQRAEQRIDAAAAPLAAPLRNVPKAPQ